MLDWSIYSSLGQQIFPLLLTALNASMSNILNNDDGLYTEFTLDPKLPPTLLATFVVDMITSCESWKNHMLNLKHTFWIWSHMGM